jgi:hypothetical protein
MRERVAFSHRATPLRPPHELADRVIFPEKYSHFGDWPAPFGGQGLASDRYPVVGKFDRADFVHDVSTVHRCPRLWTPDGIVTNRDAVSFWVHGVYPVSRCPMGQGGVRAVSSLLGFERSFLVRRGEPEIRRSKSPATCHTTIRPRRG